MVVPLVDKRLPSKHLVNGPLGNPFSKCSYGLWLANYSCSYAVWLRLLVSIQGKLLVNRAGIGEGNSSG